MKNCVLRVIIVLSTIHPSLNDNKHNLWQTGCHEGETSEVSPLVVLLIDLRKMNMQILRLQKLT